MLNRGFSVLKVECIQHLNHHTYHSNVFIVYFVLFFANRSETFIFPYAKSDYLCIYSQMHSTTPSSYLSQKKCFMVKCIQHLNHHTYHNLLIVYCTLSLPTDLKFPSSSWSSSIWWPWLLSIIISPAQSPSLWKSSMLSSQPSLDSVK